MRAAFIVGLAGAAILFAGTALADGTSAGSGNQQDDQNKVICKQQEATIGTRFAPPPVCHTKAQWAQMQRDAEQNLDRGQHIQSSPQGH